MNSDRVERDDLTTIPGIGPARQQWLAEAFGVRTYADLAVLSADEIETKLSADGKPYARDEVERWIQEAAEQAAKKEDIDTRPSVEPSTPVSANSHEEKVEPIATTAPNAGDEQWQRIALFQVEFQRRKPEDAAAEKRTLINYHDIDKWDEWPYIETEKIGQWIVDQAGDKLRPAPEEVPVVKPEPETTVKLSLNVTRVHLYQPVGTEVSLASRKNGRPYFGVVKASHPFTAEVDFEYDKESTAIIREREISYKVQFYAQNRDTGNKLHLGDSKPGQLDGEKATYSASLTGIALPPGRYRVQALVSTDIKDSVPSYVEVPVLEVV